MRHRTLLLTVTSVLATAGLAGAALVLPSAADANSISTAKAQARALSLQVTSLTNQAESASQRYDEIEAQLGYAVNSSVSADRNAETARAAVTRARAEIDARVQALYASAGSFGMLSSLLTGNDTTTVVEHQQISANVLSSSASTVSQDEIVANRKSQQVGRTNLTALQITKLQRRAATEANKVNALLAQQQSALDHADSTVRRLLKQQQVAEAAAAAASFTSAVETSGGTISGPITAPNGIVATAIAAARSRLGVPYVWGATGPDSFDCSGLTQWSYAHAGIAIPRTAAEQWFSGPHPSLSQLEPGDLLFYAYDLSDPATIHHVTMYIGNGEMIAAPETGENVQVQPVYMDGFFGATRPWASSISG